MKWELVCWKNFPALLAALGIAAFYEMRFYPSSCVCLFSQGQLTRRPEGESWPAFGLVQVESQETTERKVLRRRLNERRRAALMFLNSRGRPEL
ncbi:hypothetical protein [Rhizobium mongolense]|uniref:Secreted protein n=1 Tax=Rhizobium mongolense TaxID=57676 RepID=A0ABR6IX26_9HYPH|nr:hypothetical protein [Rhizobium mongolense]MBB4232220.1 hypothetical protein [Rhizobium mongolense]